MLAAVPALMSKDIGFVELNYRNLDRRSHFVAGSLLVLDQSIACFIGIFYYLGIDYFRNWFTVESTCFVMLGS